MTAVVWHVAMSLDGYVAAPGDDMRWVFEVAEFDDAAREVMSTTGAILMGRRTYEVEDRERPGIYGGAWKGALFVLTHRRPATVPDWMTGEFVDASIDDAVARAKAAAADLNVGILGATVARQCLDAGLLDELAIQITPILLGGGTRLLDRPGAQHTRLEKVGLVDSGQVTDLRFRVRV
jgi:dihydrofolate reductase